MSGTLTLPEGCGPDTPVLVMVTGSGQQNRDEELFSHKPFAVIADAFARAGIATLRYDDRGFGLSTGDVTLCTTEDLKNDALAGIELLRGRFRKVGVLGHSEGGSIALMLAAEKKADFAVSLAGMIVSGAGTLLAQNRHALENAGVASADVNAYCRLLSDTFEAIRTDSPLPSADIYGLPDALSQNFSLAAREFTTPYFRNFLSLNVSEILPEVSCPVLCLNGTKDTQVDAESNLEALRSGLAANPALTTVRAEEGLNHLFQHCSTGEVTEYRDIEETFSPEVLSEMISWIGNLFRIAEPERN